MQKTFPEVQVYQWYDIEKFVAYLALKMQKHFDGLKEAYEDSMPHIVPISRGGNIPATMLAHVLNIPIRHMVAVNTYKERKQQEDRVVFNIPPMSAKDIRDAIFVEDIIDTGETIKYLCETYPNASFLALVGKTKGLNVTYNNLISSPPVIIEDEATWIAFPWEKSVIRDEPEVRLDGTLPDEVDHE